MTGAPMTLEQAHEWLCNTRLYLTTMGDFLQRISEGIPSGAIIRNYISELTPTNA